MRFLALSGTNVRQEHLELMQALVRRSSEGLRSSPANGTAAPLGLRMPNVERGIALRMVASGCPAADERTPPEGFGLPPSRTHRLLLTGTHELLSAQDLVSLLAARKLVGSLELKTERETFTLELDSGAVAHMHTDTPGTGERLGDLLVQRGFLSTLQVENIRARNRRGHIGEALLVGNWVSRAQLLAVLESQVHILIGRLCQAKTHRFAFWQGPLVLARTELRLGVDTLLLEPLAGEPEAVAHTGG